MLVALLTGTGGLLGYVYASDVTPVYEAEVTLFVATRGERFGDQRAAGHLVPTYAELVRSSPVLEATIAKLGLPLSPAELAPDVRGESPGGTGLLTIRARNRDPAVAVAIVGAVAGELRRFVRAAQAGGRTLADAGGDAAAAGVRLRILGRDSKPSRVRPQTRLSMQLGAVAGFFGALAAAVLVELRGRRVRDEDDLARVGFPVLGSVDGGLMARKRRARSELRPSSGVDSYDLLAARISGGGNGTAPRSLLVLGAQGRDRSATVALNLALAFAEAGTRVAIADLGRRREITRLAARTGLLSPTGKRIGAVRHGTVTLDRFRLGGSPLLVLVTSRSAEQGRTSREQTEALVGRLLADADFLVVHAASLRSSPDALAWARAVDAAVLVARREHTRRDSVAAALESLELARTNLLGTVLHLGTRV